MKKPKLITRGYARLGRTFPFVFRLGRLAGKHSEAAKRYQAQRKMLNSISSGGDFKVLYGPFKGLTYPKANSVGSVWLPKILGTYESELHDVLERICKKTYPVVVDIGAGEGYYAVGLAKRMPDVKVFAFETNPQGQELCGKMSELNEVGDRVIVSGMCDVKRLAELVDHKGGLIFSDCEGSELELLRPDALPNLRHFDLLVEMHDYSTVGPTVSQVLFSRFSDTHTVEMINIRKRKPMDHLNLQDLEPGEREVVVAENRKFSVGWVFLESKGA
jgi:hypothetical protein